MTDKLAEEIFNDQASFNKWLKELTESEVDHILSMMQAYHEAKMEEVTDADIVKYAFNCYPDSYNMRVACVNGARAFRDGEIKHIET